MHIYDTISYWLQVTGPKGHWS